MSSYYGVRCHSSLSCWVFTHLHKLPFWKKIFRNSFSTHFLCHIFASYSTSFGTSSQRVLRVDISSATLMTFKAYATDCGKNKKEAFKFTSLMGLLMMGLLLILRRVLSKEKGVLGTQAFSNCKFLSVCWILSSYCPTLTSILAPTMAICCSSCNKYLTNKPLSHFWDIEKTPIISSVLSS